MVDKASLKIDVWAEESLPADEDLSEALAYHVKHVATMCEQGYLAGEIVDDRFKGWWKIERE